MGGKLFCATNMAYTAHQPRTACQWFGASCTRPASLKQPCQRFGDSRTRRTARKRNAYQDASALVLQRR